MNTLLSLIALLSFSTTQVTTTENTQDTQIQANEDGGNGTGSKKTVFWP